MKYYALMDQSLHGPFDAEALMSLPNFSRRTLVQVQERLDSDYSRWTEAGEVPLLALLMDTRDRGATHARSAAALDAFTAARRANERDAAALRRDVVEGVAAQRAALEGIRADMSVLVARIVDVEAALKGIRAAVYWASGVVAVVGLVLAARPFLSPRSAPPPAPATAVPPMEAAKETPPQAVVPSPKPAPLPTPTYATPVPARPLVVKEPPPAQPAPEAVKPLPAKPVVAADPPKAVAPPSVKPVPTKPAAPKSAAVKPAVPESVGPPPPARDAVAEGKAVDLVRSYLLPEPSAARCPRSIEEELEGSGGPARTPQEVVDCAAVARIFAIRDELSKARRWSKKKALKRVEQAMAQLGGFEEAFPLEGDAKPSKGGAYLVELRRSDRLAGKVSELYEAELAAGSTASQRYEADLGARVVRPLPGP